MKKSFIVIILIKKLVQKKGLCNNKDFDIGSREKFLYDDVIDILHGNKKVEDPIYFILGSLEEFMCQNVIYPRMSGEELINCRTKNDNYLMNGYICLEEKNCIMEMIEVIKERIG